MNNDLENGHCVISYRLLRLLQWIIEHDQEGLKKLISQAVKNGLPLHAEKVMKKNDTLDLELQQSIIDYFSLLEILIGEVAHEYENAYDLQRKLVPSLERVDTNFCDAATVASSLESITSKQLSPLKEKDVIKQVVFKELLKRWKPVKKSFVH